MLNGAVLLALLVAIASLAAPATAHASSLTWWGNNCGYSANAGQNYCGSVPSNYLQTQSYPSPQTYGTFGDQANSAGFCVPYSIYPIPTFSYSAPYAVFDTSQENTGECSAQGTYWYHKMIPGFDPGWNCSSWCGMVHWTFLPSGVYAGDRPWGTGGSPVFHLDEGIQNGSAGFNPGGFAYQILCFVVYDAGSQQNFEFCTEPWESNTSHDNVWNAESPGSTPAQLYPNEPISQQTTPTIRVILPECNGIAGHDGGCQEIGGNPSAELTGQSVSASQFTTALNDLNFWIAYGGHSTSGCSGGKYYIQYDPPAGQCFSLYSTNLNNYSLVSLEQDGEGVNIANFQFGEAGLGATTNY